ncbi:ATP-dependent DNA helicase RuvA [Salegentibacter salinarum]|uniref:Holliday junction branch migration complex subunit RuvA n=2 Tax=Salegentibacter TaxID=143222 RepID=A0A1M7MWD6_9FLAO|nr:MULTISPECIES: Holliday junction branch migration protein RuvA [Salegentibacter]PKD17510.1 ATP-dependent DNA helicase RuvA [Salegentibacter salinarum]PRX52466.1 Holliday junction DNA helicase subunit RuvA [Salegentibacter salegens]SHM95480.1 Holliday junction DNA helicase subunit RuvA [Salegentibacter salegens]SKB47795.1 Holliday junction DNA helicase subunit RuvA [Salegentibacter salinarum]
MIHHLKGQLIEKNPTYLVIACNGVGYMVNISLHTFSLIPDSENISVYTHLHVKEDSHTLYGFYQKSERDIFRLLISVSGVGTSTARTMLSSLEPNQVKDAIANGDVPTIQSVKGIGAKTAQRVILDLKDKILKVYGEDEVFVPQDNTIKEEALSALETLGFARKQATRVVDKIMKDSASPTVESIIKMALKNL